MVRELIRRLEPANDESPTDGEPSLSDEELRERESARDSLRVYMRLAFPIMDPRMPLVEGFYFDALCDHAQAFGLRQIKNIVTTIPPRFTKSSIWSIGMPTWLWTRDARRRLLVGSFAGGPNIEHANRARTVIESLWYQRQFGERVRLRDDQNQKEYYENTEGGYRITTHVGGGTGKGGDLTILDDPHNIDERHSKKKLASVISWHDTVWFGRLDDLINGGRAVIMQRIDANDLAGHLIASGEYEHLNLPQEYSKKRQVTVEGGKRIAIKPTSLGFVDPRKEEGELLCPQRMGTREVAAARKLLKGDFSGIQNQDPQPIAGKLFKREWFTKIVRVAPPDAMRCRGWDGAGTEDGGDYTAGVELAWARDGKIYVEHVVRGQWGPAEADAQMLAQVKLDGNRVQQYEEQEGGSAGVKVCVAHQRLLKGYAYDYDTAKGDKPTRARPFRSECEAGNVFIVEGEWNQAYIDELCAFDQGQNDDQVDATSAAYNWLVENRPIDDELVVG